MNAKCERINKHNYNCIDLFKLFAALLVVIIHVNEVGSFIPDCIISSFSNFAVPFFFIVYVQESSKNFTNVKKTAFAGCLFVSILNF